MGVKFYCLLQRPLHGCKKNEKICFCGFDKTTEAIDTKLYRRYRLGRAQVRKESYGNLMKTVKDRQGSKMWTPSKKFQNLKYLIDSNHFLKVY
jgi:hypothetical protein